MIKWHLQIAWIELKRAAAEIRTMRFWERSTAALLFAAAVTLLIFWILTHLLR